MSTRLTIFHEILRWDHQRSYHIYKERYARCLNWSKKSGIFPLSWLLDKNMLRFQKFRLVLCTWPCRLLKHKERYESLLLIACHEVALRQPYKRRELIHYLKQIFVPLGRLTPLVQKYWWKKDEKPTIEHSYKDHFPADYENKSLIDV